MGCELSEPITINTNIDLDQLDKDLARVRTKIRNLQDQLTKRNLKQNALDEEAKALAAAADEAKAKVAQLQAELAKPTSYESFQRAQAELAEATRNADALDKAYNKAADKADNFRAETAITEELLSQQEQTAADLTRMIQEQAKDESKVADAAEKVKSSIEKTGKSLKQRITSMVKSLLFFSLISKMLSHVREYFTDMIKQNTEAAAAVGRLKGAFQTLAQPILQAVLPVFIKIVDWITRIIQALTQLIALLTGKTVKAFQDAAKNAGKANKKAGQLAAFDTIQKLGSSGGGSELEASYELAEMTNDEMAKTLALVGAIGAALLAWKLSPGLLEGIKALASGGGFGGILSTLGKIAGAVMFVIGLVKGIRDYVTAWNEGLDMSNLLNLFLDLGLIAGGLALMFGKVGAGIGLVVGGIALLVLGFKDIMENGANLTNVLTVIAGLFAAGLGISIMTKSWIPLLVAGIAAIVFALVAVGGEAEELVAGIKDILSGLVKFFKGVFSGDMEMAFEGLKQAGKGLVNSLLAIAAGLVNAIVKGLNWLIDKINTISFGVPDWVPIIGGKTVGFNLPHVNEWTNIPYLAQGAVIPPNREFLAVLGDQKSGTNIEAPLDTLVAAFKAAQADRPLNVVIRYEGTLAGIARELRPAILVEGQRVGPTFWGTK